MQMQVPLPDAFVQVVQPLWGNVERRVLEISVIEAYRDGLISCGKLGEILGLASRWDAEQFLADRGVALPYDATDLAQDMATMRQLEAEGTLPSR
jgi:predicted HTH domain antitoxin